MSRTADGRSSVLLALGLHLLQSWPSEELSTTAQRRGTKVYNHTNDNNNNNINNDNNNNNNNDTTTTTNNNNDNNNSDNHHNNNNSFLPASTGGHRV